MGNTIYFGIRMPKSLKDAIAKMAKENDRSIGSMIRVLLREALAARGVHVQDKN